MLSAAYDRTNATIRRAGGCGRDEPSRPRIDSDHEASRDRGGERDLAASRRPPGDREVGEAPEHPAEPRLVATSVGPETVQSLVEPRYGNLANGDAGGPVSGAEVNAASEPQMRPLRAGD